MSRNQAVTRNNLLPSRISAVLLAAALAATFSVSALAGGGAHGHHGDRITAKFDDMDSNKDGLLTQAEADAYRAQKLNQLDANHDGAVSYDEAKAYRQVQRDERARARFAKLDSNADGIVSVDEYSAKADGMFTRLDKNADGVVAKDELPQGRHHRGRHAAEGGDK